MMPKIQKLQYVHSAPFDWLFLLAPFWTSFAYLAALYVLPTMESQIFLVSYILLAETHFAITWFVYLDSDNRSYFRTRPRIFLFIPVLILIGSVIIGTFVSLKSLFLISAMFSLFHVTRQSTGIVSLYRSKAGNVDPGQRRLEEYTLYSAALFFTSIGFVRFYLNESSPVKWIAYYLGDFRPGFYAITAVLGALTLVCFVLSVHKEWQRSQTGNLISPSKWIVFLYSILLYSPYVFASRLEHAIGIGVSVHYLQYLGLVGLLDFNKYANASGVLGFFRRYLWIALIYLLLYAGVMLYLRQGGWKWNEFGEFSVLYSLTIGLWMVHFFIDGYIWRFSDPYIRKSVAPYLKRLSPQES